MMSNLILSSLEQYFLIDKQIDEIAKEAINQSIFKDKYARHEITLHLDEWYFDHKFKRWIFLNNCCIAPIKKARKYIQQFININDLTIFLCETMNIKEPDTNGFLTVVILNPNRKIDLKESKYIGQLIDDKKINSFAEYREKYKQEYYFFGKQKL